MKKFKKKPIVIFFAVVVAALAVAATHTAWLNRSPETEPIFGVTFSKIYAEELGLDWKETFQAIEGMGVDYYRIPVYWSAIEQQKNIYRWEDLDWLVDQSEKSNNHLTLAIGAKVPRWPECFIPDWVDQISLETELFEFIEQVVNRYKDSPAVIRWQVENEALFPFGVCPKPNPDRFFREVELVRRLDDKPIQLTVSGELDPWIDMATEADILGVSMYRLTWNDLFGYFLYPITPGFYRTRVASVSSLVDQVIISELQAEPWFPEPISTRSPEQWYEAFNEDIFRRNVKFAVRTGMSEVYLWGAEWWYFLKLNQEERLWQVGQEIFQDKFSY
ncbi:endo-1,4-beta-xylanase [Patescibacteria group bacterium]